MESMEKTVEVGSVRGESLCLHALGAVDHLLGNWEEAAKNLDLSVELARKVGSTFGEVLGIQRAATIQTALGNLPEGHDLLLPVAQRVTRKRHGLVGARRFGFVSA